MYVELDPNLICFSSFSVFGLDRNSATSNFSRGGGVLMAIRSNLSPFLININSCNIEQIIVAAKIFSKLFIFGSVYLPPSIPLQSYECHVSSVDEIMSIHSLPSFILLGDYNLPNIVWSSENLGLVAWTNYIHNFFGTLLDFVFSSFNEVTASSATSPIVSADV
ncbi:hypothetical protein QTP88_028298 [Uroleucon formosanum]